MKYIYCYAHSTHEYGNCITKKTSRVVAHQVLSSISKKHPPLINHCVKESISTDEFSLFIDLSAHSQTIDTLHPSAINEDT